MNLKKFPKIELHVHLDGSVDLNLACNLLNKDIDEVKELMIAKDKCRDLNEYLTKFDTPISIMQTKENIKLISKNLGINLINDGVIYAEVRFAPIFHTKYLSLEEVVDSVLEGFEDLPIKINLILCMMRNSSFEDNVKIINLTKKYLNKGVCAIDLAGAESIYKTSNFKDLFDIINEYNIPMTIHAGEADGCSSIDSAIEFNTKRIGHGIRCIENIDTLNRIKENNITLEVCPTSNVQTNVVSEYKNHPIKYLYDNNIRVTINTDNRSVSNITLTKEYEKLVNTFNFSVNDLIKMNINAIEVSFLSNEEKDELLNIFNNKINELKKN